VRDLPHHDAVPGNAALSPDGGRGSAPAQKLRPLRYGTRRLSAAQHVGGRARRRVRVALRAALFASIDLAKAAARPAGGAAYLAMSYLYKRSNRFWHLLIRHRLTATVWRPLVEASRRRHVRFREELAARPTPAEPRRSLAVFPQACDSR